MSTPVTPAGRWGSTRANSESFHARSVVAASTPSQDAGGRRCGRRQQGLFRRPGNCWNWSWRRGAAPPALIQPARWTRRSSLCTILAAFSGPRYDCSKILQAAAGMYPLGNVMRRQAHGRCTTALRGNSSDSRRDCSRRASAAGTTRLSASASSCSVSGAVTSVPGGTWPA